MLRFLSNRFESFNRVEYKPTMAPSLFWWKPADDKYDENGNPLGRAVLDTPLGACPGAPSKILVTEAFVEKLNQGILKSSFEEMWVS